MIDLTVLKTFYWRGRWRSEGEVIQTASSAEAQTLALAGSAEYVDPPSAELLETANAETATRWLARAGTEIARWQLTALRAEDVLRVYGEIV
jgi:hypothetical protein